jgi:oligopeptide transport system permease protein
VITRAWGVTVAILVASLVVMSFLNFEIAGWYLWFSFFVTFGGAVGIVIRDGRGLFLLRRVLGAVFTLWVIATLTFFLLRLLPGGPFDSEKALSPEIMENLARKYNLDAPIFTQYTDYLGGLLRLELGQSYKYIGRDISSIIADSIPNSIQLGTYALLIAYLIGIPLGVVAGWRPNSWLDQGSMIFAISGVALPSFLMASIFIYIFARGLEWLPPALWLGPEYYLMPMIVLGLRPAAEIARLTRASVLEVIHSDYIRTARAKGLDTKTILFKHVLRNSLIPVLTLAGPLAAAVLTGSFVIEQIFAIPGIAKHLVQSVVNRDYPLILGTALLFSVLLVVANLITDVLMAMVDPRVKMS